MNNIIDGTTVAAEHSLTPTAARTYATDMVRALIVGLVTIGVALFGLPAGTASAAPPLAAQGTSPARIRFDASVSASQYAALKIARDVINKDTKGRTLDYKKARKRFGKHSTYRRELAAAWLTSGGRIKNISKAESTKVRKYRPTSNKTAAKGLASTGTGTNCTGDTTYFTFGPGAPNYYFYDSCDTEDIKTGLTLCMIGAVLVAQSCSMSVSEPAWPSSSRAVARQVR